MARLSILVVFSVVVVVIVGHRINPFTKCPIVDGLSGLNVDDILGSWFLIEVYEGKIIKGTNPCISITIERIDDTSLKIVQSRVLDPFDFKLIDSTISSTGTLIINDPSVPAKMTVKWPKNILGAAEFTIMQVKKDDYLSFYECNTVWGFASRDSAGILSRTQNIANATLNTIKEGLIDSGIEIKPFTTVDHSDCISKAEADINLQIDDESPNLFALVDDNEIIAIEKLDNVKEFLGEQNPEYSGPQEPIP